MSVFHPWSAMAMASTVWVLVACNPTFNWRELRLEGAPLLALMPCKPETATRPVPMLDQPTVLHMHSCEAGGLTFAVAWAELPDASKAVEAMDQWQAASLAAIRVAPANAQAWGFQLAGVTAQRGLRAQGSDHQGQALQSQTAYFSQGTKVYQAAIYGPRIAADTSATFFDGLSLQ